MLYNKFKFRKNDSEVLNINLLRRKKKGTFIILH